MAETSKFLPLMNRSNKDAPLGDLNVDQYTYSNFIYPLDLGVPGSGYDHYAVFYINETSRTQYATRTVGGAAPTDKSTIASLAKKDATEDFGVDAANKMESRPTNRVATMIVLYMPPEINTDYNAKWEQSEMGAGMDVLNMFSGQQGAISDAMKSLGAGAAGNIAKAADEFTGLNIGDAVSMKSRFAINPHMEVLFRGIDFRRFHFDFKFTPQSEEEAENVANIIEAFAFYSAPEVKQGTAGRFWLYPAEFDIKFYSNGKENLFLKKISTCALTDIKVNNTPVGHWAAFRDHSNGKGAPPIASTLSLEFQELEVMQKRRILDGY